MRRNFRNLAINALLCVLGVLICQAGRIIAAASTQYLYLDTSGIMLVSLLGGYVPGILTAVLSSTITYMSDPQTVYFLSSSVVIAIITTYFRDKGYFKKIYFIMLYLVLTVAIIRMTRILSFVPDIGNLFRELAFDFADKIVCLTFALFIYKLVPKEVRKSLNLSLWMQKPVDPEQMKTINKKNGLSGSLKTWMVMLLGTTSVLLTILVMFASNKLFSEYTIDENYETASALAKLAGKAIDADRVDEYIEKGDAAEGYKEVEDYFQSLKESSPDVEYIYVYKIMEDGCHVVFDLDSESAEGSEPGEVIGFDEAFEPYLPTLLSGKRLEEPVVSNETYGWLLTAYEPVYDSSGRCACYAAVDISMEDLQVYGSMFLRRLLSIAFGVLSLMLAVSIFLADYHIIYPVNTMAYSAEAFFCNVGDERKKHVEQIRNLEISTGDEIQNLYNAFTRSAEEITSYFEDMQVKTQSLSRMQNGLILVLADMVENRDLSTGDHVRKTAVYTKIIMEEMRRKGYYTEELTDQFMSDVFKSAPLHDVGKIVVPDSILNKPGKLDDYEFDVMKTHTVAGEKIIKQVMESLPDSAYLKEALNMAWCHHEKWDGTGYPRGLSGDEIPLSACIMAVADVFDALVSRRCYKDAIPFEEAMDIIGKDSGTHFNPKVAEAFLSAKAQVREVTESFSKKEIVRLTETVETDIYFS